MITHCAHVFCRRCIEDVIKTSEANPRCPLCRGCISMDVLLEVPPDAEDVDEGDGSAEWHSSSKVMTLRRLTTSPLQTGSAIHLEEALLHKVHFHFISPRLWPKFLTSSRLFEVQINLNLSLVLILLNLNLVLNSLIILSSAFYIRLSSQTETQA